jgi:preprotein translocase subunit Sss1
LLPIPTAEFSKTLAATALGAFIMGMIAFVVKIIHIPVTQMLVSGGGSS